MRNALPLEIDDTMRDILKYLIMHEPTTLYGISKNTRYAISTIYKKAHRMLEYGLIRVIDGDWIPHGRERGIYVTTVKGLLYCLAYGCVDDDLIIKKFCHKWQLGNYCCKRMLQVISTLPNLLRINEDALRLIEEPRAFMMLLLNNLDRLKGLTNEDLLRDIINTVTHYLVSRLFLDDGIVTKSSLLVGNEYFAASLSPGGYVYVYACRLCDEQCYAMYLPIKGQCALLHEIRRLREVVGK